MAGDLVGIEAYLRDAGDDSITAYTVTLNPSGLTYTFPNSTPNGSYYFDYYVYDQADNTWGTSGRRNITVTALDLVPDTFNIGADVANADPSAETIRTQVIAGIDSGQDVTVSATGFGQVSTDSASWTTSVIRQLGETVYVRGIASTTYGDTRSIGISCNGVSDSFTITTRAAYGPTITTQPSDQTVNVGSLATFTVAANTGGLADPVSYVWRIDSVNQPSSDNPTFTDVPDTEGVYSVDVIITSSEGASVTSNAATYTVIPAVTRVTIPEGVITGRGISLAGATGVPINVRQTTGELIYSTTVDLAASGDTHIDSNENGPISGQVYIGFPSSIDNTESLFLVTVVGVP